MPRPPRLDLVDVTQHVIQRGNDRRPCFFDDEDRERYLATLAISARRYGCAVHAYVLMTNHVHLLVTPRSRGAVSRTMQRLGSLHAARVNANQGRTGTLWEGRFRSCLVDSEQYALSCIRYIELNPVRAGMVADAGGFRWSSFAFHARGVHDELISPHPTYLSLGHDREERCAAYRVVVREAGYAAEIAELRACTQQQRAYGSARFQAETGALVGRCVRVRPGGRQAGKSSDSRPDPDRAR
jgi:putative transposase